MTTQLTHFHKMMKINFSFKFISGIFISVITKNERTFWPHLHYLQRHQNNHCSLLIVHTSQIQQLTAVILMLFVAWTAKTSEFCSRYASYWRKQVKKATRKKEKKKKWNKPKTWHSLRVLNLLQTQEFMCMFDGRKGAGQEGAERVFYSSLAGNRRLGKNDNFWPAWSPSS